MGLYTLEHMRSLFQILNIESSDDNVIAVIKAGQDALVSPTYSEALRLLSFAWDCAGVEQPAATYHAAIMLDGLLKEREKGA